MQPSLQEMASDPAAFRSALMIPSAVGLRPFSAIVADFQRERFAAIDRAFVAVSRGEKPECGKFWWEATKGASKDTDLALCILWLMAFHSGPPLTCQVGAADQDQADELRKVAKSILWANTWLSDAIAIQGSSIVGKLNGSTCEIIPADIAGSHGARPNVLILNELHAIQSREFAENLLDNASKVPNGVVVIATNAGVLHSWQWDWRELARESPRWSFHKFDRPAPWIDEAELAEARRRNSRSRYLRLWEGVWVTDAGDGLNDDDITAAITRPGPMVRYVEGFTFVAGLDLGIRRDHAGWAVLAADHERQRVRLAEVREWCPSPGVDVDLLAVKAAVRDSHQRFKLAGMFFDPSQAQLMVQEMRYDGIGLSCIETSQQGRASAIQATAMLEAFRSRRIDLFDDHRVIRDLKKLRFIEKNYGMRLDAVRDENGHADIAKALSFCLPAALHLCNCELIADEGYDYAIA